MEHTTTAHANHAADARKEIWRVTGILTVLTIVELALGFYMMNVPLDEHSKRSFIKGAIIILMVSKAFYIIAYFMHMKYEVKNLIMTTAIPLTLFIWFIIAFLYEGNSYKNLRNTYDGHFRDRKEIMAPVSEKEAVKEIKAEQKPAE